MCCYRIVKTCRRRNGRHSLRLLGANKRLNTAYLLKEQFAQLWDYRSATWARRFFDEWRRSLRWQRLPSFEQFADLIDRHWDGIAAYCAPENKVALGFVEGLNNKIRVIQRRCYGIRDENYLHLKILTCTLPTTSQTLKSNKITHTKSRRASYINSLHRPSAKSQQRLARERSTNRRVKSLGCVTRIRSVARFKFDASRTIGGCEHVVTACAQVERAGLIDARNEFDSVAAQQLTRSWTAVVSESLTSRRVSIQAIFRKRSNRL